MCTLLPPKHGTMAADPVPRFRANGPAGLEVEGWLLSTRRRAEKKGVAVETETAESDGLQVVRKSRFRDPPRNPGPSTPPLQLGCALIHGLFTRMALHF